VASSGPPTIRYVHKARETSVPFWRARGYQPLDGMIAHYDWKDIDQLEESRHPMQFWHRML
jgi:hypothetical protein